MEEIFAKRVSADEAFDALAKVERRHVIERLRTTDSSLDVASLTEGADTGTRIQYHHVHLPKLDALGAIEWDRERDVVSSGPAFEQIESVAATLE